MADAVVIETGLANIASVLAAIERCGLAPRTTRDPAEVARAEFAVLPGVGAFGPGMQRLREDGLAQAVIDRVAADRPTLAICLGLQLLGVESDESPGVIGLGVVPVGVRRIRPGVRSPHFGWNRVEPEGPDQLVRPGFAYFANSFCLERVPAGWSASMVDHGGPLVASIERGCVLACQFHPELSGRFGIALLSRWVSRSRERTGGVAC